MQDGLSIESFVRTILLGDLRCLTYDHHFLAFGPISVGIEFLGACQDEQEFGAERLSGKRFERGVEDFMRLVNPLYSTYNRSFNLYKNLRCGMAHIMRPQGSISFACRQNTRCAGQNHLALIGGSTLILVAEDFYDDFAKACELLLVELPRKTTRKFTDTYLPTWEIPRKARARFEEVVGISKKILDPDTSRPQSGSVTASGCPANYRSFR